MLAIIIAVAVTLVIAIPVSILGTNSYHKKVTEKKVGGAEQQARVIIDEAVKTAETKKKEILIEAKEEAMRSKNDLEKEVRERRAEISKSESRVAQKEENLDKKLESADRKEQSLVAREERIEKEKQEVAKLNEQRVQELERISGLTSQQAKEYLLKTVQDDVKADAAKYVKERLAEAKDEADKKAKDIVVTAIQRCAADHVAESTISVVQLPNDEMKGRIIGREGRNIRTLETLTGVELIVDDTPEAVVLSAFDPVRREVARIALEKLIVDGRIHPARIEEMVDKAKKEVENTIREEGEAAALDAGVHGLAPEEIRLLGRLKYRTSFGQNVLKHSSEVSQLAGLLAAEVGVDVRIAKRAGLLHDIGKAVDHQQEQSESHVQLGVDICKKYKDILIQAADTISAARPGARRETLDNYTNRIQQLEDVANSFDGVEKSFAIQAGREVRVMVVPEKISDADMVLLARDITKKIENELQYPGQIKVNVIRESRVTDYAK